MYNFDTRQQFITHRAGGKSIREIAAAMNISPHTCYNWSKEYKSEIDAERRNVVGRILARAGAGRNERVRKSAELFNRLSQKLLDDSSKIDYQALAMYIKLHQLLDKCDPPVVITEQPEQQEEVIPDTMDLFAHIREARAVRAENAPAATSAQPSPTAVQSTVETVEETASVNAAGSTGDDPGDQLEKSPEPVLTEAEMRKREEIRKQEVEFWEFHRRRIERR